MACRGALIALEGPKNIQDVQSQLLETYLKSQCVPCTVIEFPNFDTCIGKLLETCIQKTDIDPRSVFHLWLANKWEFQIKIENWIRKGVIVIAKSYSASMMAKFCAEGLDVKWCKSQESKFLIPDLTVFFKSNVDKSCLKTFYTNEFLEKILQDQKNIEIVDGTMEDEFIHFQICGMTNCALSFVWQ